MISSLLNVTIPVAAGDRRDVRLIQAACGEQLHHEEEENQRERQRKEMGSVSFSSVRLLSLCAASPFVAIDR